MLAIVGGKGGCGKTTTAIGLARAFATGGERSLVVDADCDMPNLHTMTETDLTPGVAAFADGAPSSLVVHRSQAYPGIEVVPAGAASGALDAETARKLARLPGRVVVDCPAGATDAVATPARVADGALVVSTADPRSIADAAKTARMVESLGTRLYGAVVTRVTGDGGPDEAQTAALRQECPILTTVPEIDGEVTGSRVGRASYGRLADRLRERNV